MQDLVIPLLCESKEYWRGVGFFSSGWLKVAAMGITGLLKNGGTAKIVCSPILAENDWQAIVKGSEQTQNDILNNCLEQNLLEIASALENDTLNCLSWLVYDGLIEFRFAVIRAGWGNGDYHDKVAVFSDTSGSSVAIHGSFNDSIHGTINGEAFSVFQSWVPGQEPFVERHDARLKSLWFDENRQFKVFRTPDAIKEKIIQLRTSTQPPYIFPGKNIKYDHQAIEVTKESRPLWPHQNDAIELWKAAGCKGILEMATGTGKTVTALSAFSRIQEKGERLALVILVPYLHLVDQWRIECESFKLSTIECSSNNPNWPIISRSIITDFRTGALQNICFIATHDTAATTRFTDVFLRLPADKSFLIADEVHGLGSKNHRMALLPIFAYRLGLSATPDRWFDDDGTKCLKSYFNGVCFSYTLSRTPDFGHSKNQTYFSHVFLEVFLWNQLERSMTGRLSESRFG
jgi:Cdc6-like AAA superfamily ATPase